jgi:hypothetical protein
MLVLIGTVLVSLGLSVVTERILTTGRDALARGVLLFGGELGANGRVGSNKLLD